MPITLILTSNVNKQKKSNYTNGKIRVYQNGLKKISQVYAV